MANKKIKSVFDYLGGNEAYLNQSQVSFVASLWKYYKRNKTLSEKQIYILKEITKYVQRQGVPVTEKTLF